MVECDSTLKNEIYLFLFFSFSFFSSFLATSTQSKAIRQHIKAKSLTGSQYTLVHKDKISGKMISSYNSDELLPAERDYLRHERFMSSFRTSLWSTTLNAIVNNLAGCLASALNIPTCISMMLDTECSFRLSPTVFVTRVGHDKHSESVTILKFSPLIRVCCCYGRKGSECFITSFFAIRSPTGTQVRAA